MTTGETEVPACCPVNRLISGSNRLRMNTKCAVLAVRTCIPKCANTQPVHELKSVVGASFLTTMDHSISNQSFPTTMNHSLCNQCFLTTKDHSLAINALPRRWSRRWYTATRTNVPDNRIEPKCRRCCPIEPKGRPQPDSGARRYLPKPCLTRIGE